MDRRAAQALDSADPLSGYRTNFTDDEGGAIYLDGNSLGRPAKAMVESLNAALHDWSANLVGG